ncbi:MAG: SEC-C metal-binding domain-containing protein [Planctomycetota bacterium]
MEANQHMTPEALVAEAMTAPITRLGISQLARRLQDVDLLEGLPLAIEQANEHAVTALLLAHCHAERPLSSRVLGEAIPHLESAQHAFALVSRCQDDPVPMLIELAASERLSHERKSLVLFAAAEWCRDREKPAELLTQIRIHARQPLSDGAGIVLGLAAKAAGDPDVNEVAGLWIAFTAISPGMRRELLSMWKKPIAEGLPDAEEGPFLDAGTVRRPVAKVGRNDPCPCGSGKKYKRCCAQEDSARVARASPVAGLTSEEFLAQAHRHMSNEEFRGLRPARLAQLDWKEFTEAQLVIAFRKFLDYRDWKRAEQILEIFPTRKMIGDVDEFRAELVDLASRSGESEIARRNVDRISKPEVWRGTSRLALPLLERSPDALDLLEAAARESLEEPLSDHPIDLAFALLEHVPALGILVARSVVDPARAFDAEVLLFTIEQARDQLGLPPNDFAQSVYDWRSGELMQTHLAESINDDLRRKVEQLQSRAEEASSRVEALERELRAKTNQLETMQAETSEEAERPAPSKGEAAPSGPSKEEVERLRRKVAELKGLIQEGNETRGDLRRQLSRLGQELAAANESHPTREDSEPEQDPHETDADIPDRLTALLPEFGPSFEGTLRRAPTEVASKALTLTGSLAGGERPIWQRCKQLKKTKDVWSIRLNREQRLLFRPEFENGRLEILEIVPRRDLEKVLKSYR